VETDQLMRFRLPIAPSFEQERIVAAIEEQFSRLDTGVAALARVPPEVAGLRASLLARAYEDGCAEGGPTPLADVIGRNSQFMDGDWVESKDQDSAGTFRLTQLADVGDGIWRDRSERNMNAEQFDRLSCTRLQINDVLIARMPDPLGRACLFPGDANPCATVVDVAIIRADPDRILPRWLMWMLNTPQVRSQVESMAKGTTRKRISRRNLALVALPNIDVGSQMRHAERLDRSLDGLQIVAAEIARQRKRGERLRSSILSTAFAGKLVSQDQDDEPASILLDRIATERMATDGHKPTRTRNPRTTRQKVSA